ncbi:MAG: hypothetical protein GXO73_00315 [Calditrichaeota bacterium]|nr:hypothetical protein [Calditrichota bacterium]
MEIRGIGPGLGPQEYQRQNAEKAQQPNEAPRQDDIQISEEAKRLFKEKAADATAVSSQEQRVADLEEKLTQKLVSAGAVGSPEEARSLASRVAAKAFEGGETSDRLEAIRQNVASGAYDSKEVLNKVADRLMEDMGL